MNSKSYKEYEEVTMKKALKQKDPIKFIRDFHEIEVVIDDEVPDNITEVWTKERYEEYKKQKGE